MVRRWARCVVLGSVVGLGTSTSVASAGASMVIGKRKKMQIHGLE
jgi:hypothetical protein